MKRAFCAAVASLATLLVVHCGGAARTVTTAPSEHGAIRLTLTPNPIVAHHVSDETYDFPFEVIIRETGGHRVTVRNIGIDVYALGSLRIHSETYDANRIRTLGYPTEIAPYGELRYRFNPRKAVPDDRLFGGVTAALHIEADDDTSTPIRAQTDVTVTRAVRPPA